MSDNVLTLAEYRRLLSGGVLDVEHPALTHFHRAMSKMGVPRWAYRVEVEWDPARMGDHLVAEAIAWSDREWKRVGSRYILSDGFGDASDYYVEFAAEEAAVRLVRYLEEVNR